MDKGRVASKNATFPGQDSQNKNRGDQQNQLLLPG
jgi:hypothetical protein